MSKQLIMKFQNSGKMQAGTGTNAGMGGGQSSTPTSPSGFNGWSQLGNAADMVSGFFPEASEYQGDKGNITAGLDSAYDAASSTLMNFPPWGTIAGGAMKLGSLLNKGLKKAGVGTDGMTTKDAIFGSDFLALTPIGLINSLGAKKTDSFSRNTETWEMAGNSYNGALQTNQRALNEQGKKYGRFSRSEYYDAQADIQMAGREQNMLSTVMNKYKMGQDSLVNQSDMNAQQYLNSVQGGYDQSLVRSAKIGGILSNSEAIRRTKSLLFKFPVTMIEPEEMIDDDDLDIEKFQNGGQMSLIPEGALHAHKHHIEDVREDLDGDITHKGIPVIDNEGNQTAEIERNEIILSLDVTNQIEDLRKQYHEEESPSKRDEIARKAGEILSNEICENTDDRTGLIEQIEE